MAQIQLIGTSNGTFITGSANPSATSMSYSHTIGSGKNRVIVVGIAISGYYEGGNPYSVASVTFAGLTMKNAVRKQVTEEYVGLTWQSTTEIWFLYEDDVGPTPFGSASVTGSVSVVFNKPLVYDINIAAASASFSNVDYRRGVFKNVGLPSVYISPHFYSTGSAYPDFDYAWSFLSLPLVHYDNGYMFDIIAVSGNLVDGIQTGSAYLKEEYQSPIVRRTISSTGPYTQNRMSMACSTMATLDEFRWGDDPQADEPDNAWSYWIAYQNSATSPPPAFDDAYLRYFQHHSHSAVMFWPVVADFYLSGTTQIFAPSVAISAEAVPQPRLPATIFATASVEDTSKAIDFTPETIISDCSIYAPIVSAAPSDWWNKYYTFRKKITIHPENEVIPLGHSIQFSLSKTETSNQSKTLQDFSDVIVVYQKNQEFYPVMTNVAEDEDYIHVSFLPVVSIDAENSDYFLYYGNLKQQSLFQRVSFLDLECPIVADYNNRFIAYLKPGDVWVDGMSNEIGSYFTITAPIKACKVQFQASSQSGIIKVDVDSQDIVSYDLFSVQEKTIEVISLSDLTPEQDAQGNLNYYHRVNVTISEQKNPASFGNVVEVKQIAYRLGFEIVLSEEQVYDYGWLAV